MKVKLKDFLREINAKTTENNQYPVLTSSKNGLFLQSDYFNKSVASKDNTGYKIVREGQFTYRSMSDTGEFFPNRLECAEIGIVSPAYPVFEIYKDEWVYGEYLKYYFKSDVFQNSIALMATGSTRTSVKFTKMKEVDINLPEIIVQKKQTEVLDKVMKVIEFRKRQLIELDNLIKSQFVEMFGDPILNPICWKKEKLEKHCDVLSGYPFKSEMYTEDGIKICGGLIIYPNKIEWSQCKYWESVSGLEDYLLNENDIVMALDRPWISEGFKIAKIVKNDLPALLIQRTARIRAIDINQDYLFYCFMIGGFDSHSNITGSLVPHISLKDIRSFEILLPPIDLQNQFASFVQQVDKLKFEVQKSLDEMQTLFDSLMQEYFG